MSHKHESVRNITLLLTTKLEFCCDEFNSKENGCGTWHGLLRLFDF